MQGLRSLFVLIYAHIPLHMTRQADFPEGYRLQHVTPPVNVIPL